MSSKMINWLVFVILCIIWGSSFILMSYSKEELSSSQVAAVRIFSAGLVFLPLAFFHIRKIPRKKLLLVILTGVFGNLVPAFLFAEAIAKNIDSSVAGILNSLTPVCVVGIAVLFFGDRIRLQQILGVILGFAGLVLLTVTRGDVSLDNIGYSLLIVVGTISYGINVNLVGHHLKGINPVHMATVSLSFMLIPTGLVLWQQGFLNLDFNDNQISLAIWASVGLGVIGSAIATALFYFLVQRAGGLFASLVTYGIPFVALFWGFIYGEKVTMVTIVCLGIILSGVYLANRKPRQDVQKEQLI
jgi:drug/metabolite transporter (DMT)-like permease